MDTWIDSTPDHEPMTDLLTVFLGLGIFTCELGRTISTTTITVADGTVGRCGASAT